MRIEIEIPKEFEEEFKKDKFKDSLQRLIADANCVAGRYEKEVAEMLIKAFEESKPAFDVEAAVIAIKEMYGVDPMYYGPEAKWGVDTAVNIIRKRGKLNVR